MNNKQREKVFEILENLANAGYEITIGKSFIKIIEPYRSLVSDNNYTEKEVYLSFGMDKFTEKTYRITLNNLFEISKKLLEDNLWA